MFHASVKWESTSLKWRDLAERRHAHYLDLYKSGRWKRYYTEEQFRIELTTAINIAERWASIAPRPEERSQPRTVRKVEPAARPEERAQPRIAPQFEPAALVDLLPAEAA
jgi:uncharacterized repeat protein (TIGR03809 family)